MTKNSEIIILGGGLAGISLAYFIDGKTTILEKEKELGGLCRSFNFSQVMHDVGPHIFFSKNKTILSLFVELTDTSEFRRSNKIFHKGTFVKYPFENDLAALEAEETEYCLKEFLNNPYENYEAKNMLQFFLRTFGEGITRLYLQPYNEKIWKFDPAFMDTQMVERIPKPPKEDVLKSAQGIETEGYRHQLYFHYPKSGGIQELINSFKKRIQNKTRVVNPVHITRIVRQADGWMVETDQGGFKSKNLINCMPLPELFNYLEAPEEVITSVNNLKYNSIYIVMLRATRDNFGDNFAVNFADKDIIFHRLSKLNFLGENYCPPGNDSVIMAEITFRPESYLASLPDQRIKEQVLDDLDRHHLVKRSTVTEIELKSFKYAYVIYDFDHRRNADNVLEFLAEQGIRCCGRFAEFEYLNMDKVVEHSYNLAREINDESGEN